jgi:hypothetical protein
MDGNLRISTGAIAGRVPCPPAAAPGQAASPRPASTRGVGVAAGAGGGPPADHTDVVELSPTARLRAAFVDARTRVVARVPAPRTDRGRFVDAHA